MRGHERLLGDPTPVEEDHIRYTKAVKDEKLPNEFWKVSTAAPWNFPGVEKYRGRQWEGNLRMDAHSRGKFERSSELFGQGRLYSTETDEMRKARDDLMPQQRFLDEDSIQGIYSKGPHLPSEGKVFVQTSKSDPPPVNSFAPPPTDLKEVPVDAVTEHNYPTAPLPPPNTRQKTHLASPVGGSALEPTDLSRMPAVPLPTVGCLPEERSPKPLPYVPRVYVEKDGTGPGQMSRERKDIELRQSPHSGGLPRTDPPPQPGLTVEEKERRVMEEVRLRTEKNFSQILGLEQPARSVLTAEDRRELLSGLVDHLDAKGEGAARRAGIHDGEKEKKQASVKTANISRERVTKEDAQARRQAFLSSDLFGRQTARPGRPLPPPSSDFTLYGFEPLDTGLELQRRLVTRNGKPSHKAASQRKKEELHSSSVFDKDPPFVPPPSEPPRKRAIPPPYQPPPRENPQGLPYTHGFYQGFPASAREMKIAHLQSSIFN
uniref:Uncharacterized protein n=1 Tax=Chromera velia CCMP2878 TaxID=1169474 RepID=A0A0G4HP84_9ALVE|eukprot:Cvel_29704.t1-p1 / transcript=Cvel_29704.t1 / gene=Cvel_29704 / organism=Chromera_velia_CCMP2878 / gene_product=hypothetical protein / transcript_product=hypothetical protein / location=Cvel_scaffold4116:9025-10975(-) / protein_length=488 / sequence_SO=supercontig / SO=protein_coding / is_pseudo=false